MLALRVKAVVTDGNPPLRIPTEFQTLGLLSYLSGTHRQRGYRTVKSFHYCSTTVVVPVLVLVASRNLEIVRPKLPGSPGLCHGTDVFLYLACVLPWVAHIHSCCHHRERIEKRVA